MADALSDLPGLELWVNENVHFQYGWTERPESLANAFASRGIGVRPLGDAHGVRPGALRIVAPRADERLQFAEAVAAMRHDSSLSGVRS